MASLEIERGSLSASIEFAKGIFQAAGCQVRERERLDGIDRFGREERISLQQADISRRTKVSLSTQYELRTLITIDLLTENGQMQFQLG